MFKSKAFTQSNYSGEYKLSGDFSFIKGKANYTYTENSNYERIKNGSFTYSANMNGTEFGMKSSNKISISIKGNYSKNLKNGRWSHIVAVKIPGNNGKVTSNVNYKNGWPHGEWSSSVYDNEKNKITESGLLKFNNNTVIGDFKSSKGKNYVKGNCDEKGFLHGKTSIVEGGTEYIREYNHGFLTLNVTRNIQSGNVIESKKADPEEMEYFNKIHSLSNTNPEELEDIPFRRVQKYNNYLIDHFAKMFKDALFSNDFPGDSSFVNSEYYWDSFKVYVLEKQETKQEKLAKEQAEAERLEAEKLAREAAEAERLEAELKKKQVEKYNIAQQAMQKSDKALNEAYTVLDQIKTAYEGKNVYKIKKKKLYNSYRKLHTEYIKKHNQSDDYEVIINFLEKAKALSDRVILLVDTKTKDLERSLKSATTTEQIEELLK